jgi:uncharacterized protein
MEFVDTNIFVRYLTFDDPDKAQACFELFQKAKNGEVTLTTTEAVVCEVVFVLASRVMYNLPRTEIRTLLYPIISLPGLKLPHRRVYLRALDLYSTQAMDFTDAVIVAQMERQKIRAVYSYDGHFNNMKGIARREP